MYSIQQLAKLANVTTRTLRYYDQLGLLHPTSYSKGGYRLYDQAALKRLQTILFYKEFNLSLEDIASLLKDEQHFKALLEKQQQLISAQQHQLALLQRNIQRTLQELKGEQIMTDNERFEGFKKALIEENEQQYGQEIRAKYGNEAIDNSNAKLMGKTEQQYEEMKQLEQRLFEQLKLGLQSGMQSNAAKEAAHLHKQWLIHSWKDYSPQMHQALADMYVADERFTAYYDQHGVGMTQFLRDAIYTYIK